MIAYGTAELARVVAEGEARFPEESCGLIFEGPKGLRVAPMENALDRYHARDPVRFPRTNRTGYLLDPRAQLDALEAAAAAGERLVAIFHSHPEVGAYFSAEDRALALTEEGEPLQPEVEYLVVSVRAGRCDAIKGFRFGATAGSRATASERDLPLPPRLD